MFSTALVQPPNSKIPIKVQRLSNLSRSALGLGNFLKKLLRLLCRQLFRPDATWFTTLVPWLFWRKTPPGRFSRIEPENGWVWFRWFFFLLRMKTLRFHVDVPGCSKKINPTPWCIMYCITTNDMNLYHLGKQQPRLHLCNQNFPHFPIVFLWKTPWISWYPSRCYEYGSNLLYLEISEMVRIRLRDRRAWFVEKTQTEGFWWLKGFSLVFELSVFLCFFWWDFDECLFWIGLVCIVEGFESNHSSDFDIRQLYYTAIVHDQFVPIKVRKVPPFGDALIKFA